VFYEIRDVGRLPQRLTKIALIIIIILNILIINIIIIITTRQEAPSTP
jgi:hypothetical protein